MFKKLYKAYISSFSGLSSEIWWLALITLINRAGAMVIPFLSLYLTKDLGFSLAKVGWILTFFGLGSIIGSWLGGKLTDKIGHYYVMVGSLISSGALFIGLQFLTDFWQVCLGVFLVMIAVDVFRPAVFVAVSAHSAPQNKTRSITLIRLAINLGFSAGPAIGGIIITALDYSGLFWVDGLTSFIAGVILLKVLHPKKARVIGESAPQKPQSAYTDGIYWIFILSMALFGFVFVQYFSTIPLYYKDAHQLSEAQIGILMGMNGFLIFAFEMPIVKYLETRSWAKIINVMTGTILVGVSFLLLNLTSWSGVLVIGMMLMTLGEMMAFPFSNAFAMQRSKRGNAGEYMALYSISFSISHVFAHNSGMQLIANWGFATTWIFMSFLAVVCWLLLLLLKRKLAKTKASFSEG